MGRGQRVPMAIAKQAHMISMSHPCVFLSLPLSERERERQGEDQLQSR